VSKRKISTPRREPKPDHPIGLVLILSSHLNLRITSARFPLGFPSQTFVCTSHLSQGFHTPIPSQTPLFHHPNYIVRSLCDNISENTSYARSSGSS